MAFDYAGTRRKNQLWIVDKFLALGVGRSLEVTPTRVFYGYELADFLRITKRTKSIDSRRIEFLKQAKRREELAKEAEKEGHLVTARNNFHLAALYYGWVMYSYQFTDSSKKIEMHAKYTSCYDKLIKYSKYPMEKVEIPYGNSSITGILHLPPNVKKAPCVIFLPGTDMIKEQFPNPKRNIFVERGLAVLSIDGPGQGESNIRNIKVRDDLWAYEKAVSATIDYLETRNEIDCEKIAIFGVSTGSYWGPRTAVYETDKKNRIKAVAGLMFNWEPALYTEFELADPRYKHNYMYMSGVHDEDEFDKTVAAAMTLDGYASKIKCPVLIVSGEYDELCSLEDVYKIFEQIQSPKEIVVYENEFHNPGNAVPECWERCVDWIKDVLDGKSMPKEKRTFVPRA